MVFLFVFFKPCHSDVIEDRRVYFSPLDGCIMEAYSTGHRSSIGTNDTEVELTDARLSEQEATYSPHNHCPIFSPKQSVGGSLFIDAGRRV